MEEAEFLITSEHDQLQTILKIFLLMQNQLLLEYYYLQGFVMIFQNASLMVYLPFENFCLKAKIHERYLPFVSFLLNWHGLCQRRRNEKAEFSIRSSRKFIYTIQSMEDTWRVLNVVFHCGVLCRKRRFRNK